MERIRRLASGGRYFKAEEKQGCDPRSLAPSSFGKKKKGSPHTYFGGAERSRTLDTLLHPVPLTLGDGRE